MSRFRMMTLSILAVCVVGAVQAASASALYNWSQEVSGVLTVNTSGTKEALASATTVTKSFVLTQTSGNLFAVTCTSLSNAGGELEGTTGGKATSLTFTGCTVTAPTSATTKCEVEKGEIVTKAVTVALGGTSPGNALVEFEPASGTEFVGIKIKSKTGQTCLEAGTLKVVGTALGENTSPGTPKEKQSLAFTTTSGSSLTFGGEPASFVGTTEIGLSSKNPFGAM